MENPVNQFIEIAPDCELKTAIVPQKRNGKQTIATIEYEILSSHPYRHDLKELKFAVEVRRKEISDKELNAHRQALWDAFFAKSHACMRASPLTKQYGWGAHYDTQGKIAIFPVESNEYKRLVDDKSIKKYFALRSGRKEV